jgi:transglutaminase-like putative cysteine protease
MFYRVTHKTTYEYTEPVSLCQNLAHLGPRETPVQLCRQTVLAVMPQPAVYSSRTDFFGNPSAFFTVQEPHRELVVTATHVVELLPHTPPEAERSPPWEEVRDLLPRDRAPAVLDAYQFVFDSRYVRTSPSLTEYAAPSFTAGRPLIEALLDLTRRIHADFLYDQCATTVATPLQDVFARRRGVCQDFAHLQIACLRGLGLAARYVSGYLSTHAAGQRRLVGTDASHAWLSVFCPMFGWIDVDPTNNQIPSDRHILLAWGRDYEDVSPIKGVILGGGQHSVKVAVDVARLGDGEAPR